MYAGCVYFQLPPTKAPTLYFNCDADYTFLGKPWQRVLEGWKHKSTSDHELKEEGAGNEANIP